MSQTDDWLDKLYIRDLLKLINDAFSKIFPRVNARLFTTEHEIPEEPFVVVESVARPDNGQSGWTGFLKSWFALMGASVFFVASPLVCAFLWRQFLASRLFVKKTTDLSDKGIVITGCDSGIGIETAAVLSAEYPEMFVFAGCLTPGGVQKLNSLKRQNLIPVKVDVTNNAQVSDFVSFVRSRLGNRKLYAIINNAGVFDGSYVEVTPVDIYTRVMDVNFFGVIRVTKAFLPFLIRGDSKKMDGGRVINISSLAELLCSPGNTAYCASKYAMSAFVDGLRQELHELGIRVIRIVPGPVRTGSLSQIPVSANALLSSGPSEVLQRYGGQAFLTAYARFFSELYDSASAPLRVAKSIQKALIRRHPRDVYYEDEKIYNVLNLCPHFVRDFLMDPRSFRKQIIARRS